MAKYIQYVVVFRLKRKDLPKRGESRKELIAKAKEKSRQLGEKIQKEFPNIKIVKITIFGPRLNIPAPEEKAEKIAVKIRQMFNCEIARADTPIELIR